MESVQSFEKKLNKIGWYLKDNRIYNNKHEKTIFSILDDNSILVSDGCLFGSHNYGSLYIDLNKCVIKIDSNIHLCISNVDGDNPSMFLSFYNYHNFY